MYNNLKLAVIAFILVFTSCKDEDAEEIGYYLLDREAYSSLLDSGFVDISTTRTSDLYYYGAYSIYFDDTYYTSLSNSSSSSGGIVSACGVNNGKTIKLATGSYTVKAYRSGRSIPSWEGSFTVNKDACTKVSF